MHTTRGGRRRWWVARRSPGYWQQRWKEGSSTRSEGANSTRAPAGAHRQSPGYCLRAALRGHRLPGQGTLSQPIRRPDEDNIARIPLRFKG